MISIARTIKLISCALVTLISILIPHFSYSFDKPQSTGPVQISGRQLLINGNPYQVRGVCYQPTPIGVDGQFGLSDDTRIFQRDFPLLNQMGSNTIRTWGKVNTNLLNYANQYNTKVVAGFWVDYNANLWDPTTRNNIISDFRDYVGQYKDHPALLAWGLGNEQNYFNGNNSAWYSLTNEMAKAAYEIEGPGYHPVSIINGEINNIGDPTPGTETDDASLDYIDMWASNVYRGYNFGNFFQDYAGKSQKPLLISEYGIDAWDNANGQEYPETQSEWNKHQWEQIKAANGISVGGTIMAYSDEWWKAGNPWSQDYGGYIINGAHPDGYSNEEWWGLVKVKYNGLGQIDTVIPRETFYTLFDDPPIPEPNSLLLLGTGLLSLFGLYGIRKNK